MRQRALPTTWKNMRRSLLAAGAGLAITLTALPAATGVLPGTAAPGARADDTTTSQSALRAGWDSSENAMSPTDVQGFTKLFARQVTGQVWAQPLVVGNTVIVATEKDYVYGLDATTGAIKWTTKVGKFYQITNCNDLSPDVGVTSGPVYDAGNNTVYVMAQIMENHPLYSLFGINASTGKITESIGVPLHPSNDSHLTFSGQNELARPGLLLLNGWVYAAFGSHCDHKPWVGYVAGFNVSSKARTLWADETGTTDNEAGIWQSGGGLMSDGTGRIFFTSGNGVSPAPGPGKTPPGQLAESVVRLGLNAAGTLSAKDFFSPSNAPKLDAGDTDWGSGSPVGLPLGTATYPHVLAQVGKDGRIFLLNRNNLGGRNASNNNAALSVSSAFNGEWGHPASFAGSPALTSSTTDDYLYYLGKGDSLRYLQFGVDSADKPVLTDIGNTSVTFGYSSGSPAVTSNDADPASAVVWVVYSANATGGNGTLEAFPATPQAAGWPSGCTTGCTVDPINSWPIGTAAKFANIATSGNRVYVGTRSGATTSGGTVYGFGAPVSAAPVAPAQQQASFGQTPVDSTATRNVSITATRTVTVTGATATTGATGTQPPPGSTAPDQFAVRTGAVTVSAPGASAKETQVTFPVTLHKGEKLTAPVTFTPSAPGGATGAVSFATSEGPQQVGLAGTGTRSGLSASASPVQFALVNDIGQFESDVPVGVEVPREFDITNFSTKPVKITSIGEPDSPYTVASGPKAGTMLQPGQSAVVQIVFKPDAPGDYPGSYSVHGSDGSTATVQLTGAGLAPDSLFTASPAVVNFGAVPVGKQATAVIRLTNTGNEPATVVSTSALIGPFRRIIRMAPQLPVNAGYDVRAPVAFTPRHPGTFSTTYTFTWSDITGTHSLTVTLKGRGV